MPPVAKRAKTSLIDDSGEDSNGRKYSTIQIIWREREQRLKALQESQSTNQSTIQATNQSTDEAPTAKPASSASTDQSITPSTDQSMDLANNQDQWYSKGHEYWNNVDASIDGVLGGFGHLDGPDIIDSRKFLKSLTNIKFDSAIDCGAGIGRVAEHLLCPMFQHVDLVEQSSHFVETAKQKIKHPHMRNFYTVGLQSFFLPPITVKYDVIWIQWVMSQLTDNDFISFLQRCKHALTPGGYVVAKENTAKKGFILDCDDSSVTRSDPLLQDLFTRSGYKIVEQATQTKFPRELFAVRMYALQPVDAETPDV